MCVNWGVTYQVISIIVRESVYERQAERHNLIRWRRKAISHRDRARRGIAHLREVICRIKVVACRLD